MPLDLHESADGWLARMREDCGYDPDKESSVDDLIAYKDALEDRASSFAEALESEIVARELRYQRLLDGNGGIPNTEEYVAYTHGLKHALARLVEGP